MSTLRFTLRADKPDRFGKCPLELIFQISGQRKKVFLEAKLHPVNWDASDQVGIYVPLAKAKKLPAFAGIKNVDAIILTDGEVDEINNSIAGTRSIISNIEKRYQLDKYVYSAEDVITAYKDNKDGKTKKTEHRDFLFDFMDQYISDHMASRAAGSLTVYKSVKNHLFEYQQATKDKVRFSNIDYGFFQRFQTYLINKGKLNNTTIAKSLSTLKTFLGYARKSGILVNDNYRNFTIKREKLEVIALSNDEFIKILNKDFSKNAKLAKVRDIFCFSCATGLRMSDLAQLKREHIKRDEIKLTVKKTKTEITIPLNKISAEILAKYADQSKPLPLISSQKINEYIKDVCKEAEINEPIELVRFIGPKRETTVYPKYKLIHIHTGRKTFVTLSLEKGMSAEQVMAITGHTDYKSFKRYVDVTKKLTKVVMIKAWGDVPKLKIV
jgi:site-specific recombinase XerD